MTVLTCKSFFNPSVSEAGLEPAMNIAANGLPPETEFPL